MARTRARDFEDKQKAILRSAASVIAELGIEKASMSQVALHANVSKALLYHYYPGKDALIFDIINTHLTELDEAVEAADDPALPPRERLRGLIWAVLDNYRGADDQHKVQLNAAGALSEDQHGEIRAIERRIVRRFSAVLKELNPKLDTPARALLTPMTMSLFGILNWVYLWFRDGGRITREEYAELVTTLMLEGIKAVR